VQQNFFSLKSYLSIGTRVGVDNDYIDLVLGICCVRDKRSRSYEWEESVRLYVYRRRRHDDSPKGNSYFYITVGKEFPKQGAQI
jgi:hypothetical protein